MKAVLLLLVAFSFSAIADDLRPVSLNIVAKDQQVFDVALKVPVRGGQRQQIDVEFDKYTQQQPRRRFYTDNSYIERWQITREQGLERFAVNMLGITNSLGDVLLRITDLDNQTVTEVLNADKQQFLLASPEQMNKQDTAVTYVVLGVEHILIGLDHLLFVACLVYISGTFRKLLLTITGFTIAHSITLVMAATGVVEIPIVPVEAVIALSIVFLAWEITKNNQHSLSLRYPVLVSSSFGLLHGFGFASVLADIGLPANEKLLALLSFNVGVELGQIIFVAALFAVFWLASRLYTSLNTEQLRLPTGYLCGSVSMIWLLERVAAF